MKNVKVDESVNVEKIAGMTPGMSGADLANLVNEAALMAVRCGKKAVGMTEFEEAVERVVAGLEKKNRVINAKEREIVAYHEMGHAIVALALPGTDPVHKISIIPRGVAALGYTMQVPTQDRFLLNRTELLNRIASLLGGRAAEEIVFGDVSTGAHNDLARATDIARSMVKEYGMSEKLGQIYLSSEKGGRFLDTISSGDAREYSEETARAIDAEIRNIIHNQYETARRSCSRGGTCWRRTPWFCWRRRRSTGRRSRAVQLGSRLIIRAIRSAGPLISLPLSDPLSCETPVQGYL